MNHQSLTDVIQGAGAEFPVELLGCKPTKVGDGVGPQM